MQRKFSEPNTYIDGLPSQDRQELLYDDVEMSELTAAVRPRAGGSMPHYHVTLALQGVHSQPPAGPSVQKSRCSKAVLCPGVGSPPGLGTALDKTAG